MRSFIIGALAVGALGSSYGDGEHDTVCKALGIEIKKC
jgi:hypothetical protein